VQPMRSTYRTRSAVVVDLACALLAPPLISAPALFGTWHGAQPIRFVFVALGLILSIISVRLAYCAIHVEPSGIRIVNPTSSRSIDWREIDRFELGRWGLLPRNCLVRLLDGSSVGVWAISARNPNLVRHDSAAEASVAELNVRLGQARNE